MPLAEWHLWARKGAGGLTTQNGEDDLCSSFDVIDDVVRIWSIRVPVGDERREGLLM
jgi:hypothetical protein